MKNTNLLIADITINEAISWIPGSGVSTLAMELYGCLSDKVDTYLLVTGGKIKDTKNINILAIDKIDNINREIIRNDIDIVHATNTRLYRQKIKIPIIQTAWYYPHSLYHRIKNELGRCAPRYPLISHMGTVKWNLNAFVKDQLAFQKASRISAVTKILQKQLQEKFDKPIYYVPCPINTDIFRKIDNIDNIENDKIDNQKNDKKFNKKNKDYIKLLFIGKASNPQKGFRFIKKALFNLKNTESAKAKKIRLKIVGHINNSEIEYLNKFYVVEYLPFIKRNILPKIFADCDIFIFPSTYEEYGYVLLEAMACEMPIIASDIHSIREILDGVGILFAPEDVYALQNAIIKLIENPELREQMGKNARKRVLDTFSYEKIGTDLLTIYKDTLQI